MAKPIPPAGYEPNLLHKMVPADDDATPINDPDHDRVSDFSKTTHENPGWFGVPTVCVTSVSQISPGNFALKKEREESLTRETEGKQRMPGDRDGSVIGVGESMSRRSRRNSTCSPSHQTPRESYSDQRELREHLERRAQQAINGENSVQRNFSRLSTTWRSRIWNEEIQNMHNLSHNVSLNPTDNNY